MSKPLPRIVDDSINQPKIVNGGLVFPVIDGIDLISESIFDQEYGILFNTIQRNQDVTGVYAATLSRFVKAIDIEKQVSSLEPEKNTKVKKLQSLSIENKNMLSNSISDGSIDQNTIINNTVAQKQATLSDSFDALEKSISKGKQGKQKQEYKQVNGPYSNQRHQNQSQNQNQYQNLNHQFQSVNQNDPFPNQKNQSYNQIQNQSQNDHLFPNHSDRGRSDDAQKKSNRALSPEKPQSTVQLEFMNKLQARVSELERQNTSLNQECSRLKTDNMKVTSLQQSLNTISETNQYLIVRNKELEESTSQTSLFYDDDDIKKIFHESIQACHQSNIKLCSDKEQYLKQYLHLLSGFSIT